MHRLLQPVQGGVHGLYRRYWNVYTDSYDTGKCTQTVNASTGRCIRTTNGLLPPVLEGVLGLLTAVPEGVHGLLQPVPEGVHRLLPLVAEARFFVHEFISACTCVCLYGRVQGVQMYCNE